MNKDEALRLALEAFNKLAAWNDGEVGSHMDEPYAAEVAREVITAIKAALEAKDEPVAVAWAEGYQMGVADERTSEANIGIAGFNAKVEPARENPYVTTPPQRKPLTDEEIEDVLEAEFLGSDLKRNWQDDLLVARAIEAAHGIKGEV